MIFHKLMPNEKLSAIKNPLDAVNRKLTETAQRKLDSQK